MKRRSAVCAAVLTLIAAGCHRGDTVRQLWPAEEVTLREGDVVFRTGTGVSSRMVTHADTAGHYSHVGIAVSDSGRMMIVHAVPYEDEYDGVKMEPPEVFFSIFRAQRGAVCRTPDSLTAQRAARQARCIYKERIPFDHNYDEDDTTRLYCCQLVTTAYRRAGMQLVPHDAGHRVKLPWMQTGRCLFPSDIFRSKHLKKVSEF